MVNSFLKYLTISGAILNIDFDNFWSSKRIMKYIRKKIDLTYLTSDFYCRFLHKKNQSRRGASIREIKKLFSLKPSIVGDNQGKGKIFAEKGWGTAAGKNLKCSFRVRDKKPCKCIHAVVPTVCIRGVGSFVCSRGEGTLCVKMGFYEDKMQNEVKRILVNFKSGHSVILP